MNSVSIIIPVLNERENLAELLPYLRQIAPKSEIIVSDGGSSDGSAEVVPPGILVIQAKRGRAAQMNAGARLAQGEILWFLHADCRPHPDSLPAIRRALQNPRIRGGAFTYQHDTPEFFYKMSAFFSNRKNRFLKTVYGDMGIFIRKDVFWEIGGYPDIPLMEDMEICRLMKKEGPIVILPQTIQTSARRWKKEGALKNVVRNWTLQILWFCGVSPFHLSRWYHFE